MAFNGSGTFNRNTGVYTGSTAWTQTRDGGRKVRADDHDAHDQDIANGLSNCVTKDGQTTVTANLPMAGFRHTNCGNAVADTDYSTLGQVKAGIDTQRSTLSITNTTYSADGTGAYFRLRKSRGATPTTNTIVQNGDEIGVILFSGANGTTFDDAASIQAVVDAAPGATNDMPGRLVFFTKGDGSATLDERLRITSAGLIGVNTAVPAGQLSISSIGNDEQIISRFSNTNFGPFVILRKSRNATLDNNTIVNNGDQLGSIRFDGANGSGYTPAALIRAIVDGAPGATNDMPGALVFSTTADGTGTLTERMRINNAGQVGIGTTPSYQLHLSTDSAAKLTTNTWTVTSDARVKTNIQPYTKGLAAIKQINPVSYDYNGKAGTPVGPGGISILAQDLQPVFPECVGTYKAKLQPEDKEDTDILTYQGHAITFALINAIKELAARVEALEAQG
jgi:hypothetical protein